MPALQHTRSHEAHNGSSPRPINGPRSPTMNRPPPDYNRPLPPPPGSSVDNYDIPTLHRKPATSDNTSPSQAHTRSFSHPISSFFGSRKNEKKNAALKGSKDHDMDQSVATTPATKAGKPEPVTGKCMTCDATVRWPQGLKVFRCTTCLTINDLEPLVENTATPAPDMSSRRPLPLSLERTRSIIDHCLTRYLESQLRDPQSPIAPSYMNAEHPAFESTGTEGLFTALFPDDDSPPTSPRPSMKVRSTSDPALTPLRSRRRDGVPFSTDTGHAEQNSAETQSRITPPLGNHENTPSSPTRKGPIPIFRPLENYIADSFTGCATLNASFFTVKPHSEQRATERVPRRQQSEPVSTPTLEPDVFLSDLDAKTLLLGDFAENGSWWTGGRSWSPEKETGQKDSGRVRHGSPDRWKGIVSTRSPRVNWQDLAEWYRTVINAGELWRKKWHELRSNLDSSRDALWKSVSFERLDREVADSQLHLHRSLLKSTENLLKRPRRPLKHPEDCRFLLMLLFNPLIYPSDGQNPTLVAMSPRQNDPPQVRPPPGSTQAVPRRRIPSSNRGERNLGHHSGIIKRVLGLIANLPNEIHQFMVSWVSRFADHHFQKTVELVASFVTYRLSRQQKRVPESNDPTAGLVPSFSNRDVNHPSQLHAALDARSSTVSVKTSGGKPSLSGYGDDWQIRAASRVMALLFQANIGHPARKRDLPAHADQRLGNPVLNAKYRAHAHGQVIPVSVFYNSMLDYADLVADFEAWESTKTKFTFCQYPFFLSIYAKIHILEHDARRQMENKAREAFFDSILSRKAVSQFLVLKVRRDCLVEDSLRNVSEVVGSGGGDIKKGLRIDFVGEEGIDSGGLRKEWFLLLVREIFDPTHGLFIYDEDSQYCYFNPYCFESSEQFFLVGVLLGLAIYNSTILDVAFPPFVFKKMLASAPSTGDKLTSTPKITHGYSLEDLAEFRPALAKGLRQLLEFEGDVHETFCRDFVIEMDRYGEKLAVPLCPGGDKRTVTNSNRKEFVDMYIRYMLDTAVARQYEPFKRGFFTVCGGNALSLFRPEEIELLVRGSDEPLDITSLRAVAVYEGWPKSKDGPPPDRQPPVVWFWDFFARVSPTDQRKILSFITGSDRIPALGATNLIIKIGLLREKEDPLDKTAWRDPERFPIARTCFNSIGLYQYGSRKKLEDKLWMAVTGSEGFGLK